ncbi:hypothetical protein LHP98_02570 [Rhodobacter sp. Har01]|uniref:hypothetical protein n=1 Tax=Rhodobacter sp. Har01 TaxID=2883999 RepID=UPI001D0812E0|nr:hypothetical protein [Rhodobacter sp. Har01]MCB6177013.1 hypothetical protein [Rhodobacter sp. Har01]
MTRFLALAVLLAATPAVAKSPRDQMFPTDSSCYLRQYTLSHLASHPAQRVRQIALGPWAPEAGHQRYVALRVAVGLRGTAERFQGVAYCENEADHLFCQMEGDAGSFVLEPRPNGAVRMTLTRAGIGFEGNQDFVEISGTSGDDRVFLLPPVAAGACP